MHPYKHCGFQGGIYPISSYTSDTSKHEISAFVHEAVLNKSIYSTVRILNFKLVM